MATSNLCYPPGTWAPEVSPRRAMVHSLQHSQPQVRSSDIPQQSSGTCGPPAVTKMQSVVHAPAGPTTSGKRLAKKAAMPTSTCRRSIKLDGESSCVPYNTDKPVGMQEQLQALQREDPQTVLIARRIHTLGFHSAQKLEDYFCQFGSLKTVLVPHSRVKASLGRRARARTGNIGFIVFHSVHSAQIVLSLGDTQEISESLVTISPFQHRDSGSTNQATDTSIDVVPSHTSHAMSPGNQLILCCPWKQFDSPSQVQNNQWQTPSDMMQVSTYCSTATGSSGSSGSSTPRTRSSLNPPWADVCEGDRKGNSYALYGMHENRIDEPLMLADQGFVTDDEF